MGKKTYRVGIVGLGRIASLFEEDKRMDKPCTHAGAYTDTPNTEIVAACDIRQDRLDRFYNTWNSKQKYGINLYKDYKEMLRKEKLDILSICTHAPEHPEITITAANSKPYSGISAVFCEKPMATNLRLAENMIDACKKNNVILFIDHTRRLDEDSIRMKEITESGKIGKVRVIDSYCTAGLFNGGGHLFDMLRFLNGDVKSVYAKLRRDKSTDPGGVGLLKFKNGSYAFVDCDFRNFVFFELKALGTCGLVKYRGMIRGEKGFDVEYGKPSKKQSGLLELYPNKIRNEKYKKEMPLIKAVREITDLIQGNYRGKPTCSGEDGKAAIELALAFHESDRTGKEVALPLKNKYLTVIPRETAFTEDGKLKEQ